MLADLITQIQELITQYEKGLILDHEALRAIVAMVTTKDVLDALDNA